MNDSRESLPSSKPSMAKPQWMNSGDEQPIVGRIVSVGTGVAPTESGSRPAASQENSQAVIADANGDAESADAADEPLGKIGRSKLAILTTVFVVAGVLGVPLIVYSPAFSKGEKIFWSTVATLYSGVLLYILYRVIAWFISQI